MIKSEFLLSLENELSELSGMNVEEQLSFYTEMIEDRMEDGLSEEEAVAQIGSVDEIVSQILMNIPFSKLMKKKVEPKKRMGVWEIIFLALGSPVWISLLLAAIAVLFALYVGFWSVIVSLWAVFVSLATCVLGCFCVGVFFILTGDVPSGAVAVGAGFVCAGLSVWMFFGCKLASKGTLSLTNMIVIFVKKRLAKERSAL